jgi:hypothetical protein
MNLNLKRINIYDKISSIRVNYNFSQFFNKLIFFNYLLIYFIKNTQKNLIQYLVSILNKNCILKLFNKMFMIKVNMKIL